MISTLLVISLISLLQISSSELPRNLQDLDWIVGKWRGEFNGKTRWPTIPTMTYGEQIEIYPAPVAKRAGLQMFNYSAKSWSHSTLDGFHDEWGFLNLQNGKATLMTSGNNGFNKYEEGTAGYGYMRLKLEDIARIHFTRDLPVRDLEREFRLIGGDQMEQVLKMRTETNPRDGYSLKEHARIVYNKVKDDYSN